MLEEVVEDRAEKHCGGVTASGDVGGCPCGESPASPRG